MPDARGLRALVLDDDEYALEFLRAVLQDRYPRLTIETRLEPKPQAGYDLYFLDDDFDGVRLAGELARRIRAQVPQALILAFSASLDARTLRELLLAGCNGVCDKKVPSDLPEMLDALDRCIETLARERVEAQEPQNVFSAFRSLFAEWNRRLDELEGGAPRASSAPDANGDNGAPRANGDESA